MPSGMDSGSGNAKARNDSNAKNKYTLGPNTYGISASGDPNSLKISASVGVPSYVSASMGGVDGANVYPGFEIDIENVGR